MGSRLMPLRFASAVSKDFEDVYLAPPQLYREENMAERASSSWASSSFQVFLKSHGI